MAENLKQTRNDPNNEYYAYVTRDDLVDVFERDDVVLTIRNFDRCDRSSASSNDNVKRSHTLRLHGQWKPIDVRLVTEEGEAMRATTNNLKIENGTTNSEQNEFNGMIVGIPSQQPTDELTGARRRGRRRKRHIIKEDENENEDADTVSDGMEIVNDGDINQKLDERMSTAQTLFGFQPTRKYLKRNLDEDSSECR